MKRFAAALTADGFLLRLGSRVADAVIVLGLGLGVLGLLVLTGGLVL